MSAAILLVMILTKALGDKVRPAIRHVCYVLVFIALLVPFRPGIFRLPTPTPGIQRAAVSYAHEANPSFRRGIDAAFIQTQELVQNWNYFRTEPVPVFNRDSNPAYLAPASPAAAGSSYPILANSPPAAETNTPLWRSITIHQLLLGIWAAGALAFIAFSAIRHMRFVANIKRHSLQIEDGPACAILSRIRHSLRMRRKIRLWSNPAVTVPVVFGLLRPTIVLPEYEAAIDDSKLQIFILHEALHVKRLDIAAKFICLVALALHWFNPLVHWLFYRANEECERACDEAVIAHIGTENRLSYSQTLLFAAKQSHGLKKAAMTLALTSDGKKLKNRLVGIMNNVAPKRWVLILCTTLLLAVVMTFGLVSCGRGGATPNNNADVVPIWMPCPDDPNPFYGQTLTIAAPFGMQWDGHDLRMINAYRRQRPGVTVEIIDLDLDAGQEQMSVQLMSGTAPTLIHNLFVDNYSPSVNVFFADWFPLMDASPSFDEDDYFMNVFHGSAVNGRLYFFPTSFNFMAVAANSSVPGLAEAFEGLDGVSVEQMMELRQQSPAGSQLYLGQNYDVVTGVMVSLHSFFDMETRMVDFNNQRFIDFINYSRESTNPNPSPGHGNQSIFSGPIEDAAWSQRYYFLNVPGTVNQYFMSFEEDLIFTNAIPMVNHQGEVIIGTWGYGLNVQASPVEQALALDFMQFITSAENNAIVVRPPVSTVNRQLQRIAVAQHLDFFVSQTRAFGWRLSAAQFETAENISERFAAISDMPMTTFQVPQAIQTIILEALADFHLGLATAEQTAQDLQNRIALFMMEME